MGISAHAQREVARRAEAVLTERAPRLEAVSRRVLTALLARTATGARLLVRPEPVAGQAVAFLVTGRGVFAVLIGEQVPADTELGQTVLHAEQRCAGVTGSRGQVLARSAIHLAVVLGGEAGAPRERRLGWVLTEAQLPELFRREAAHLDRTQVDSVAAQLVKRLPEYLELRVSPPERAQPAEGLLELAEITEDQVGAAQRRPFESWLTFLHPRQQAVAVRDYSGPARISGPAGTGKTVVALHRLRHLARRSTGPLLFTTFVRTLPLVHKASFARLAPELADRVEFTNLHAWAREFLRERGHDLTIRSSSAETAFSRAWMAHRLALQEIEDVGYWRTEIDRVIKGRGVGSLAEYQRTPRRGRVRRLDGGQRELVWALFQSYQRYLAERGLHDHNDLIALALAELRREPPQRPYAAVVVDEVQDITLMGLRLLRELAGDGPNRLLLVGDGQQQVYPGGWRLSDAGIPVQGRGEVLRINYRNRAEVLGFAQRFDATNQVDDLDGAAGVGLREAESANEGGEIQSWRGPEAELGPALRSALAGSTVPSGRTAVIVFHRKDLDRCTALLRAAGIPMLRLDDYVGAEDDRVKVGTVHRAKGLDFQAVLVVEFGARPQEDEEQRALRERQQLVAATRARDFLWWGTAEAG
ncbi:AAA family ATPase [Crossiella sp. SN42]|uniref:UvrD-helicase domain-containing protein n=1 Tax=Crossiella sp. SN42 TaxID=2944808 RepID=UPI00207C2A78|nr:UvrD-helicase domain-containing protein [Crossiella sp. SN42]MCO1581811.1 AAA family ATPase [Crossiella sp. SN42]